MKPNIYRAALALGVASLLTSAFAETSHSPRIGFVRMKTSPDADTAFGLPLHRQPAWVGKAAGVSGNIVTIAASLADDALVSTSHYLLVTSGQLVGHSFNVTGNTENTITVDPNATSDVAAQGLQAGDAFKVIPFWTLGTLFPDGKGMVKSTDPFAPASLVRTYDPNEVGTDHLPTKSYLYFGGDVAQVPKGFYDITNFGAGLQDNVPLSPETHLLIRNGAESEDLVIAGAVPGSTVGTAVGRFENATSQDNLVVNPYPIEIELGNSGLVESGAVEASPNPFAPTDLVRFYPETTGKDPLPTKSFLFFNGPGAPTGWYDITNFQAGVQDTFEIPGGAAFIIRKGSGDAGTAMWLPAAPYETE